MYYRLPKKGAIDNRDYILFDKNPPEGLRYFEVPRGLAFLTEGVTKIFQMISYGNMISHYYWFKTLKSHTKIFSSSDI